VVEILSSGDKNQKRDREAKHALLSTRVQEYWIFDPKERKIEIYRREKAILKLAATLFSQDELTSPILPGFTCLVDKLF
jgi:Uma2 family endonuclease